MPSTEAVTLNQALNALRLAVGTKHEDEAIEVYREVLARIRLKQEQERLR